MSVEDCQAGTKLSKRSFFLSDVGKREYIRCPTSEPEAQSKGPPHRHVHGYLWVYYSMCFCLFWYHVILNIFFKHLIIFSVSVLSLRWGIVVRLNMWKYGKNEAYWKNSAALLMDPYEIIYYIADSSEGPFLLCIGKKIVKN